MSEHDADVRDCVEAVERVARRFPDHVAIIDGDLAWTFQDLLEQTSARADRLVSSGLRPGDRVALVAENSAGFLASALAVWRAGGVLVTVYPSSSAGDLQYALINSDPSLVLLGATFEEAQLGELLSQFPTARIDAEHLPRVRTDAEPNPEGLREPLSLICFSSGTSSRPKAIMLSAKAVLNCARTYSEVWHLSESDIGIVCLPMAWMYGLASTSLALLYSGATVVVVRRARPEIIAAAVSSNRATFLPGVANTFAKLVRYVSEVADPVPDLTSLRLCISGGEPRNETAFGRWTELTGQFVLDAYCASECLPLVTYDPATDPQPRVGSAGKLVPRAKLRVVDPAGEDVPPGEVGEGISTGPGIMLGYWRSPDETVAALTSEGWYRTQDLLRIDADGYVYVVGRLSDLIIRAGVNISPAEVERVVRDHDDVEDVAVVGLADEMYGQRVVAAVVARQGKSIDIDDLERFATERLTAYKVPSAFITMDELPLNANGKVSRKDVAAELAARELSAEGSGR
jgi:long-chain acyl-CoA synthetase